MTTVLGTTESGEDVGAWVLRCDPELHNPADDIVEFGAVLSWPVHDATRIAMLRSGHPCVLWVHGSADGTIEAGIYAQGSVVHNDEGDIIYMAVADHDPVGNDDMVPYVHCDMRWMATPLLRTTIEATPQLRSIEVLADPDMTSPSILTPEQYDAVCQADLREGPVPEETLRLFDELCPPDFGVDLLIEILGPDGEPRIQLLASEASYGVALLSDTDGSDDEEPTFTLVADTPDLEAAFDVLVDAVARSTWSFPIQRGEVVDAIPAAISPLEDGVTALIRHGESEWSEYFLDHESDASEHDATYPTIGAFLEAMRQRFTEDDD